MCGKNKKYDKNPEIRQNISVLNDQLVVFFIKQGLECISWIDKFYLLALGIKEVGLMSKILKIKDTIYYCL